MGAYPYFFVEKYNYDKGKWENVVLYTKDDQGEFRTVELWPWNGTHDLFGALGFEPGSEFEMDYAHYGLPGNCSEEVKSLYEGMYKDTQWEAPQVKWFNLADMKLSLNKSPKIIDSNAMEETWEQSEVAYEDLEKIYIDNPLKDFIDTVTSYVSMATDFIDEYTPSDVRVIGWMSY